MTIADKKGTSVVGQGIQRFDADEKVRGLAQYADDIHVPDCWFGHIVRSHVSRGRLKSLHFDPDFDWDRVAVVTPDDIPGENIVHFMVKDMPFIAHDQIEYLGEPVALVAAPTRQLAQEAAEHIRAEIEQGPAIHTIQEVVDIYKKDPAGLLEQWAQTIRKGDVEAGFTEADDIVTGEYWTGHQEQLYIEPQGMIAIPEKDGGMFILGSMQCPYYINPELCSTLDIPPEKLRVKQTSVGGGFGGKEEFPTMLGGYCALLALKCGKPVKIIYDRNQDILFSTKRHPSWTRCRVGLKKDGTMTAVKAEFLLDGGAYTTLSPVVLFRGILHVALAYRCEHVSIDGHVYSTNTFPNGAFRGFGAPQAVWAIESHADKMADAVGMTPDAFRLHNCIREGDTTATGQVLTESVGSPAVLEEALRQSRFAEKHALCTRGKATDGTWYGIGVAFFGHGAGFTGDGEAKITNKAALDLEYFDDGSPGIHVRVSSTEMGQGAHTVLCQIAADALSIHIDRVRCPLPDTSLVPDSGPTVASRTTMVVGNTVHGAGVKLKKEIEDFASDEFFEGQKCELIDDFFEPALGGEGVPFERAASIYLKREGPKRVYNKFMLPAHIKWNQVTFEGDAYPTYSWGCNVAEVEVDPLTLELHVKRITAYFDIGRVINPILAKGQVEGGLVQALGYAVMEKLQIVDGKFDADRMQTYVIPTMQDLPEMDIQFVEFPYEYATPGAKGVGEIPMDGLAAAIANAVEAAVGVRFTEIPITPEKLFDAMKGDVSGAA